MAEGDGLLKGIIEDGSTADLAVLVSGCRDDDEGFQAKKHVVRKHVASSGGDLLQVMCALHARKVIVLPGDALIRALTFKPSSKGAGDNKLQAAQDHPGFFLATALASCTSPSEMPSAVAGFFNVNDKIDVVAAIAYVNSRGFVEYDASDLEQLAAWRPPDDDDGVKAAWKLQWGLNDPIPTGPPWYGFVKDSRGRRAKLAFLGSVTEADDPGGSCPSLAPPSEILMRKWKLQQPSTCVTVDAGSMHPRQLDSIHRMAHLPQFYEWVQMQIDKSGETAQTVLNAVAKIGGSTSPTKKSRSHAEAVQSSVVARYSTATIAAASGDGTPIRSSELQTGLSNRNGTELPTGEGVTLNKLMQATMPQWRSMMDAVNTDELLGDGSINNVIFTKVKEVFAALVDAIMLSNGWLIIDRTDGSGSATAELLLELALERGTSRPAIVVIDSLERLGKGREGSRARKMLKQLHDLFMNEDCVTHGEILGTEKDFTIDCASPRTHVILCLPLRACCMYSLIGHSLYVAHTPRNTRSAPQISTLPRNSCRPAHSRVSRTGSYRSQSSRSTSARTTTTPAILIASGDTSTLTESSRAGPTLSSKTTTRMSSGWKKQEQKGSFTRMATRAPSTGCVQTSSRASQS